jgi:predicted component of type VI protein secretion system
MAVKLKVVQGKPDGPCLNFPDGDYLIGRGPECHVRHQSELISRRHCLLRVRGLSVHVRDLGSTNGTLLNGWPIAGERAMSQGEILQIGPLVLELLLESADCASPNVPTPAPGVPASTPGPEAYRETMDELTVMQFKFGNAKFKAHYPSEEHAEEAARRLASFILRRGSKQAIRTMREAAQDMKPLDEPSGLDALQV